MLMFFIILRKQATCWGNVWVVSYCPKWSQQIRLQDSLIINMNGRNQSVSSIFWYYIWDYFWDYRQRKVASQTTFFIWVWPVVPLNEISRFFDHQYLEKESIDILVFLHGVNHQENIASEITTFHWVQSGVFCGQSDSRIFSSSISLERINLGLRNFFSVKIVIKGS